MVRDQPWTGYNWYDGGYRSRVDINLDLPLRLPGLVGVTAHETYPGHHLEHALKEQTLVEELGRLEASVLLINTPECLISEGLANVGKAIAVPVAERADLLVELAPLAGAPLAADAGRLREAAARQVAVTNARGILDEARLNAALMLHEDGRPRQEVLDYLVEVGRFAPDTVEKRLEFSEHPLWRTYVFVYAEGETLLQRWLDAVPEKDRPARFAPAAARAAHAPGHRGRDRRGHPRLRLSAARRGSAGRRRRSHAVRVRDRLPSTGTR